MAQEKVHGGVEAGIDPDEDNLAKISCHYDHINGEKQHKVEDLQFLRTS